MARYFPVRYCNCPICDPTREIVNLGYNGELQLPKKESMMLVYKDSGGRKWPMKHLILEPGESKSRLVIRNANDSSEPRVHMEMNYEGALELRKKLDEAIQKMVDDRVVKTEIQVRF